MAANQSSTAQPLPPESRREMGRLSVLFATLYFIQGIAEPGEGLISQPLKSLMKSWGETAGSIAMVSMVIGLPWSVKPLYGFLTDFVPLFGSRRRNYLLVCSVATVVSLVCLFFPPEKGAFGVFILLLLVATVGVAFTDIVVDALMVEKGQPMGMTGRLQSVQWTAIYGATILTGSLGGYLSGHHWQKYSFLICGLITLPTIFMAWFFVDESRSPRPPRNLGEDFKLLWHTAKSPAILTVCGFLFLLNFNPFSSTILYLRMTKDLGWSEQFYGNTSSIYAVGCMLGSMTYAFYCRRVPVPILIHVGIAACVLSTLGYWAMTTRAAAMVISFLMGLAYITTTLIQLDVAARACPPAAAGTTFALLMAVSNTGVSISMWVGGIVSDFYNTIMNPTGTFNALVFVGAACTAASWFLVPWLRRHPPTEGAAVE